MTLLLAQQKVLMLPKIWKSPGATLEEIIEGDPN